MTRSRTSTNVARFIPGTVGAILVSAGVAVIYWPAGIIVAGLLLLALDRRIH